MSIALSVDKHHSQLVLIYPSVVTKARQLHVCLTALVMNFAGNISACVITNNEYMMVSKENIRQIFESCVQTFEGYNILYPI